MLERALRLIAIGASLLVILGWGWFAAQQAGEASKTTQAEIAGQVVVAPTTVDPDPDAERQREQLSSKPHELVDDANDVLLRPFTALADGFGSEWVRRSIPALLGLLVYGFGLGTLARFAGGRRF